MIFLFSQAFIHFDIHDFSFLSPELAGLTGLRLRMTELGDVPRLPGRALSRFFALKEMRMMGSCMCHGHASRCLPDTYSNALPDSVQVGANSTALESTLWTRPGLQLCRAQTVLVLYIVSSHTAIYVYKYLWRKIIYKPGS